ncbi:hypothetical protein IKQ38_00175 [Candidatus Saccharibacteria bacterium]|nr:hypothetical protein [Candidatus Saccharibacteria bacterium]
MAKKPEVVSGAKSGGKTGWESVSGTPYAGKAPERMTRREANRDFERSEGYRAVQRLKAAGLLKDFNSDEMYHGRTAKAGEGDWHVDRHYDNAGNATGHANINKVAALNVAEIGVAKDYARLRSTHEGGKGELYRIQSSDPDAVVIDRHFSFKTGPDGKKRTSAEQAKIREDLIKTMPDLADAVPLDFGQRKALDKTPPSAFYKIAGKKPWAEQYFTADDVTKICEQTGLASSTVRKMCEALNTRQMIVQDPGFAARNFLIARKACKPNEKYPGALLSQEYFASWSQSTHTIGVSRRVKSPHIRRSFRASFLFELGKVDSAENLEAQRESRWRRTGRVALRMERLMGREKSDTPYFQRILRNPNTDSRKLVEEAKKVGNYKRIFESDSGVKEKYTLQEHTETVLRNFDENYADKVPAKLVPLMHLALLVHDIGKPEAARNGEKSNQKVYNDKEARRFMKQIGIGPHTSELVRGMIGHAQELTTKGFIKGDAKARAELDKYCRQMLVNLGIQNPTKDDIGGMRDLCLMIQACDSAAYTTMARTRDVKTNITYRNLGSFNKSFMEPTGQNKRDIRMKNISNWVWD